MPFFLVGSSWKYNLHLNWVLKPTSADSHYACGPTLTEFCSCGELFYLKPSQVWHRQQEREYKKDHTERSCIHSSSIPPDCGISSAACFSIFKMQISILVLSDLIAIL